LFRVFGLDSKSGLPRQLDVDVADERLAWKRAESQGIDPRDIITLPANGSTPAETPSRKGAVYLIACGSYFKIGKSTNPRLRYAQLKIQLPEKPKLIHQIDINNFDYVEKHWHKRFASKRANGEWFALDGEDITEFMQCEGMVFRDDKRVGETEPESRGRS
jgi:hypothetical protein